MVSKILVGVGALILSLLSKPGFSQSKPEIAPKGEPSVASNRYILIRASHLNEGTGHDIEDLRRSSIKFEELTEEEMRTIQRQIHESIKPETNGIR